MKARLTMISAILTLTLSRQKQERAITFIELLIVIIIIGVLVIVAIPQFRKTFDDYVLENFVKDIYYLCHYLKGSAISQAKIHGLNIDSNKGEIWATYEETKNQFQELEGRFAKVYTLPDGVTLSININPPDKTKIYFYPDGSIDNATLIFENKYEKEISLISQGAMGELKIE